MCALSVRGASIALLVVQLQLIERISVCRAVAVKVRRENDMARYSTTCSTANFRAARPRPRRLRTGLTTRAATTNELALKTRRGNQPSDELTFREVIVPLDGSSYAEHALPWAIQIASLAGARLRLVHVHEQMQPPFHERRLKGYREFDRLLREPMEGYVSELMRRIARTSAVTVTRTIVDGRQTADHLSEVVAAWRVHQWRADWAS
jgi:nucleotide-binding universal stress UspA family protein